jgi:hypothetical protein
MVAARFLRSGSQPRQPASGASATPHGASGAGTSPTDGHPGGNPTAGQTSPTPRTYTGAAQDILNRTRVSAPPSPSSGGASPGAPAAPGTASRTPGTSFEQPTPRPGTAPSVGGTSSGAGNVAPTPESGTQIGSGPSRSARPETGGRS